LFLVRCHVRYAGNAVAESTRVMTSYEMISCGADATATAYLLLHKPADFYGASALLPLTDEEIVDRLKSHIQTCEPGFKDANVIDSAVLRFPKAVTHFSPGSYPSRPYQVTGIPNCFLAGDWVKGVGYQAGVWPIKVCAPCVGACLPVWTSLLKHHNISCSCC
jgi:uncharacterized protein with NAD-binding domain and iron-sulfur cluster